MSKKIFNVVKRNSPKRNAFDLAHERKFSCNMGDLVPIMCEEVVPGDSFRNRTEFILRLAPLVAPMMHRVNVYTHFFFVPNRLVWDEWQDFITGGVDGTLSPVHPYITTGLLDTVDGLDVGGVADYLGLHVNQADIPGSGTVNSLPLRAYQLIFNEFYRDPNLETELAINKESGAEDTGDSIILAALRKRCWEHDYFTSALPWTQRGNEVSLPLGTEAPLLYDYTQGETVLRNTATGGIYAGTSPSNTQAINDGDLRADGYTLDVDVTSHTTADLANATSATLNDLRTAVHLQRWLERNARSGSRYIEQMFSHFGVMSSDARLQRPEYLGGGKSPVVVSEVLQTGETGTNPQGNLAGHGIAVGNTHEFKKFFEEHGFVIGIMSVMPRTAYGQGVRRFFTKTDKFDYFWPEFAHLGEQEVYTREIWYDNDVADTDVFGYSSRYAEYKFVPDSIHGDFYGTLDHWHMARQFSALPQLNESFTRSNPTHRVFADTTPTNHKVYVQCYNDLKALRPMPTFGTPTF